MIYRGYKYRVDRNALAKPFVKAVTYKLLYRGTSYLVHRNEQGKLQQLILSANLSKTTDFKLFSLVCLPIKPNTNSGDFEMENAMNTNNPSAVATSEVTLIPNNSLLTETPEEGRQLAVKMARLIIKLTQPDEAKRLQLRDVYGNDAMMLIAVGQTVATEFATIAAANNYWRK